ncbi:peptidoglycan DD-metalloendopeptidase family protein [Halomonas cerina]|uniref:Lipoprotein NlpD n=1 Tax=Halomonas cerina TaxID=447424 RepID=A0A839VA46_9GAMM|nr:peptidoglycan DD-metalloendopeptidase family protein [Halomonas cerina]MBB3189587.1 lipoprotein NlpD [Halomonas cerina]
MYRILLISGLTLALSGCTVNQSKAPPVQVRDLSMSRSTATPGEYTVKAGDTLYGIAWRHNMDYRDLARLNRIGPPYRIQTGQTLVLGGNGPAESDAAPAREAGGAVATALGGTAAVSGGGNESLDWVLPDAPHESDERAEAEKEDPAPASAQTDEASGPGPVVSLDSPGADGRLSERDRAERERREAGEASTGNRTRSAATNDAPASAEPPADKPARPDAGAAVAGEADSERPRERRYTPVKEVAWRWPADGDVVGAFGEGSTITAGIDIAGQKGQPVKAAGPGIVVYAGSGVRGYGNLILLKHNDQFLSAYAHNDSLRVKENDVVEAGDVIAIMGDSDAEDVRLHFEVRKDGQPQDPLEFLPPR